MNSKNRICGIDVLKGGLIILVVIGHAIQYSLPEGACYNCLLWNLIYSFHMPAFMAISGFLCYYSQNTNYFNIIKRRSYQLLFPYIIWSLFLCVIREDIDFWEIFTDPGRLFWFLWVLYIITLLFLFAKYVSEKLIVKFNYTVTFLSLLLVGGMVIMNLKSFGYNLISYYFLFYVCGYFCNKYHNILIRRKITICLLIVIWFVLAFHWRMHELPSFLDGFPYLPSSLLLYMYRFLTGLIAVWLLLSFCLQIRKKNVIIKPIAHLGTISLGIYVTHLIIVVPFSKWLVTFLNDVTTYNIYISIVISFFCCLFFSIIIVSLLRMNKLTAKLFLGLL